MLVFFNFEEDNIILYKKIDLYKRLSELFVLVFNKDRFIVF